MPSCVCVAAERVFPVIHGSQRLLRAWVVEAKRVFGRLGTECHRLQPSSHRSTHLRPPVVLAVLMVDGLGLDWKKPVAPDADQLLQATTPHTQRRQMAHVMSSETSGTRSNKGPLVGWPQELQRARTARRHPGHGALPSMGLPPSGGLELCCSLGCSLGC